MPEISDSSVLLPQPLWPMMATNSPGRDRERDALERLGLALQAEVAQADVAQLHLRRPAPAAGACTDHFALLANSVRIRSWNFTRLRCFEHVALHQDVLELLDRPFGSITGVVFQIFSLLVALDRGR